MEILAGHHVLVRTDNIEAKAHINNQEGSKSSQLHKEAQALLCWAEIHLKPLHVEHIKGVSNVQAD